ncbi:hypothetical protein YC2023_052329 [Brassica napus]
MVYRQMCVSPSAPELEHVCGRSLAKPLVTEAEGQPFRFTNDLDIDEHEDVIYFTDTSTRFRRRQFLAAVLNVDKKVNQDPKALALWSKRRSPRRVFSASRDLVLRLPMSGQRLHSLFTGGRPHATALKLSESREVLEVSEDKEGKRLRFISEVEEKDGKALDCTSEPQPVSELQPDIRLEESRTDIDYGVGILPEDNLAPGSYYEVQKLVAGLQLPYEVIDVCIDNCMIYWRADETRNIEEVVSVLAHSKSNEMACRAFHKWSKTSFTKNKQVFDGPPKEVSGKDLLKQFRYFDAERTPDVGGHENIRVSVNTTILSENATIRSENATILAELASQKKFNAEIMQKLDRLMSSSS